MSESSKARFFPCYVGESLAVASDTPVFQPHDISLRHSLRNNAKHQPLVPRAFQKSCPSISSKAGSLTIGALYQPHMNIPSLYSLSNVPDGIRPIVWLCW